MPGYYVDGNDAAAMYAVISSGMDRARGGGGPTLIEGLTYRIEAHTNSDDPSRYREKSEEDEWRAHDPIERLGKYLANANVLTRAVSEKIASEAEELAANTRDAMNQSPVLDPLELFDHVYAEQRSSLLEQRAFLENELATANGGSER
jgi:pyruvate dehydrogenase E1 component alpha subunit